MPKFRFEAEAKLAPPLAALGMPSAFSAASADFSGIAERKPGFSPFSSAACRTKPLSMSTN